MVDAHPWLDYVTITDPAGDRAVRRVRHHPAAVLDRARAVVQPPVGDAQAGLRARRGRADRRRRAADRARPGHDRASAGPARSALGLALALSSTALVLPIAGTTSPVGRAALAMLLFEDLALVPIIFLLGALAPLPRRTGWSGAVRRRSGWASLVVARDAGARPLRCCRACSPRPPAPRAPSCSSPASLLVVIVASLATAAAGLSPIVGALIAGLLIAETEYHGEVEAITAPFKGLALGVFLITVGMCIDLARDRRQLAAAAARGDRRAGCSRRWSPACCCGSCGARRAVAAEAGILMASPVGDHPDRALRGAAAAADPRPAPPPSGRSSPRSA